MSDISIGNKGERGVKLQEKLRHNAIQLEKMYSLTPLEKQTMVLEELESGLSEKELGEKWGVSRDTIHGWKTLRYLKSNGNLRFNLSFVLERVKIYTPKNSDDIELLIKIKQEIERILKNE